MLVNVGVSEFDAFSAMNYLKANPKAGIIGLYQEYIQDEEFISKLDEVVTKFLSKK